jgi:adenosylcobinamide hydrolase
LTAPESELHALEGSPALGVAAMCWRLPFPLRAMSTAPVGGGVGARSWVLNVQVPSDYARRDLGAHVAEVAGALGLSGAGVGVGMLTAAPVAGAATAEEDGVRVETTVGLRWPVWAAAPADAPQSDTGIGTGTGTGTVPEPVGARTVGPGTINVVAFVPVPHSDAALANLLCTVTEAKVQALLDGGVPGTGTASDAVTVLCPAEGVGPAEPFGGPRSLYGAKVARCLYRAIRQGAGTEAAEEWRT